jgi:hypothetical protein
VRRDNLGCSRFAEAYFEFSAGDGLKSYRLVRVDNEDTTEVQGEIEIGSENRLRMTGGYLPESLVWGFDFGRPNDFDTSVRMTLLLGDDRSVRAFLNVLGLSGGASRVEMDLSTS